MSRLTKRVWSNNELAEHTKFQVYRACVLSALLYGSESWSVHTRQEQKLKAFRMFCLRRILNIAWQDKVANTTVLEKAEILSMFSLLKQIRLRWLGHVVRMDDGRITKYLLYGELVYGKRPTGRPHLRYKDVCKRNLKAMGIVTNPWDAKANSMEADCVAGPLSIRRDTCPTERNKETEKEGL